MKLTKRQKQKIEAMELACEEQLELAYKHHFTKLAEYMSSDYIQDVDYKYGMGGKFTHSEARRMAGELVKLYKFTHHWGSDCKHGKDWSEL